ncbi:uncharacterized protein LY79DRAFT_580305 [Colletotrichum navitas]|uniref:Uncharacterized protein n=1 Tax=Colletotrichum navitas TaxID=681940 RepID=A0AAD8V429_9PEZI|nr:uncharacterized protein LY79DRAFT_580305 [Colletotrichum navitas]KAK1589876.1 hypothetical protein LY79DRAFT_580305 [Colletotrichum navitas]
MNLKSLLLLLLLLIIALAPAWGQEKYCAVPSPGQNMGIRPSAYPDVVLLQPRNAADRRHLTMHEICNAPLRCVTKPKLVTSEPQRQRYNLSSGVSGLDRFNIGPRGRGCHGHSRCIAGSLPCSLPLHTSQPPKAPGMRSHSGPSRTSALRRS